MLKHSEFCKEPFRYAAQLRRNIGQLSSVSDMDTSAMTLLWYSCARSRAHKQKKLQSTGISDAVRVFLLPFCHGAGKLASHCAMGSDVLFKLDARQPTDLAIMPRLKLSAASLSRMLHGLNCLACSQPDDADQKGSVNIFASDV